MALSKLVCYVTGAGQGLGKATALRLSKLGAKVMVVDLSEEKCKQVVAGVCVCVCMACIDSLLLTLYFVHFRISFFMFLLLLSRILACSLHERFCVLRGDYRDW